MVICLSNQLINIGARQTVSSWGGRETHDTMTASSSAFWFGYSYKVSVINQLMNFTGEACRHFRKVYSSHQLFGGMATAVFSYPVCHYTVYSLENPDTDTNRWVGNTVTTDGEYKYVGNIFLPQYLTCGFYHNTCGLLNNAPFNN